MNHKIIITLLFFLIYKNTFGQYRIDPKYKIDNNDSSIIKDRYLFKEISDTFYNIKSTAHLVHYTGTLQGLIADLWHYPLLTKFSRNIPNRLVYCYANSSLSNLHKFMQEELQNHYNFEVKDSVGIEEVLVIHKDGDSKFEFVEEHEDNFGCKKDSNDITWCYALGFDGLQNLIQRKTKRITIMPFLGEATERVITTGTVINEDLSKLHKFLIPIEYLSDLGKFNAFLRERYGLYFTIEKRPINLLHVIFKKPLKPLEQTENIISEYSFESMKKEYTPQHLIYNDTLIDATIPLDKMAALLWCNNKSAYMRFEHPYLALTGNVRCYIKTQPHKMAKFKKFAQARFILTNWLEVNDTLLDTTVYTLKVIKEKRGRTSDKEMRLAELKDLLEFQFEKIFEIENNNLKLQVDTNAIEAIKNIDDLKKYLQSIHGIAVQLIVKKVPIKYIRYGWR